MSDHPEPPSDFVSDIPVHEKQVKMITAPLEYDKRTHTDIFCTIIGLSFFAIILTLSLSLANKQAMLQTTQPSDHDGRVCGSDLPDYPFIYFFSLPDISQRICVKTCPLVADIALQCAPTANITRCRISDTVKFYFTTPVSNQRGKYCMPNQQTFKLAVLDSGKLQGKLDYFRKTSNFLLPLAAALVGCILLFILLQLVPRGTMELVLFLSLICSLVLGIILYVYQSNHNGIKLTIMVILGALFVITISQIILYRQALKINRLFMVESVRFISDNCALVLYIPLFLGILAGFILLVVYLYQAIVSIGTPSFNAYLNIYYTVNPVSFGVAIGVLIITMIWGLAAIKESFNFCVACHAINWYYHIPNDVCAFFDIVRLLLFKHLGSVIGASLINGFLFFPEVIADLFRTCVGNPKIKDNQLCLNTIDLVRSDALGYVALTGNPYCNSAKYCEYLWNETMISDHTQSTTRIHKIAAQLFITTAACILTLFIKGKADSYVILLTFLYGITICTFFVSLHAYASETIQLMYLLEEEFAKRTGDYMKYTTNVLNTGDQKLFLTDITRIYSNKQLAFAIRGILVDYWKLQLPADAQIEQTEPQEVQAAPNNRPMQFIKITQNDNPSHTTQYTSLAGKPSPPLPPPPHLRYLINSTPPPQTAPFPSPSYINTPSNTKATQTINPALINTSVQTTQAIQPHIIVANTVNPPPYPNQDNYAPSNQPVQQVQYTQPTQPVQPVQPAHIIVPNTVNSSYPRQGNYAASNQPIQPARFVVRVPTDPRDRHNI